jgi:glutathionyl-hydroquinone reductase
MLNEAFDKLGGAPEVDLYPAALRLAIDQLNAQIAHGLAKAVYDVAGARDQAEYDAAADRLFGCLDRLEQQLADGRPFLLGERGTLADLLAFTPLVRFDAVYNPLFRAARKRVVDFPGLSGFVWRVHELPGIAETVRFNDILMHYYDGDWAVAQRRGIVPERPAVDFRAAAAHR